MTPIFSADIRLNHTPGASKVGHTLPSASHSDPRKKAEPSICDFRLGCRLLRSAFPNVSQKALARIASNPHLAEALHDAGLTEYGRASIDMALALQEARMCPQDACACQS